ncbi:MAG: hypothetical protein ACM31C_06860 [Acidobacteriota bacterium]
MKDFHSIDLASLSLVIGGAGDSQQPPPSPSPNQDQFQVGAQATIPKAGPVNLGVNAQSSRSDWAYCANTVRKMGGNPKDMRDSCGLPPGAQK